MKRLLLALALLALPAAAHADGQWGLTGVPDNLKAGPSCLKFDVNGITFSINAHDADAGLRWGLVRDAYLLLKPVKVLTVNDYTPPIPIYAPMNPCVGGPLADGTFTITPTINAITVQLP